MQYLDVTHISITVPDLAAAEAAYLSLFDLEVAWRDPVPDHLPVGAPREAIEAADVRPTVAYLHRDALKIVLAEGEQPRAARGTVDHIGVQVSTEQLRAIRSRVRAASYRIVHEREDELFTFTDPYGMQWELDTRSFANPAAIAEAARARRRGGGSTPAPLNGYALRHATRHPHPGAARPRRHSACGRRALGWRRVDAGARERWRRVRLPL